MNYSLLLLLFTRSLVAQYQQRAIIGRREINYKLNVAHCRLLDFFLAVSSADGFAARLGISPVRALAHRRASRMLPSDLIQGAASKKPWRNISRMHGCTLNLDSPGHSRLISGKLYLRPRLAVSDDLVKSQPGAARRRPIRSMPRTFGDDAGVQLNDVISNEDADDSSCVGDTIAACSCGPLNKKTRPRRRYLRLALLVLCAAAVVVHIGLLSGLVSWAKRPGVFCQISGDDGCACDLGHTCDGGAACKCGDCCNVQEFDGVNHCRYCSVDAGGTDGGMPGSFEWKVSWAIANGCIPAADPSVSGGFFCPSSWQSGEPPQVESGVGNLVHGPIQHAPRKLGECYVPQTPHMVGLDHMPPV